jgi:hypothetical protein
MKKFMLFLCAITASLTTFAEPSKTLLSVFNSRFPGVNAVEWSESDAGFMATYKTQAEVSVRVFYDKNENFQYVAKTYAGAQLPVKMQKIVQQEFRGYKVNSVTECSNENGINYYVLLQSKKKICRVRYTENGEESQMIERFNVAPSN